jgi:hypothetical protein
MDNPAYNPKKSIIIAFVLFIVDAFVMNLGVIAEILLLVIVLKWLPESAILKFKKQSLKIQLTKSLIYGVMAISVISANAINNKIAKKRAEQVIDAVEQYHQANSKYPAQLSDLVPTYLSKVPEAKYTLAFNKFGYINGDKDAILFYMDLPPFGRPTFDFNDKTWGYVD